MNYNEAETRFYRIDPILRDKGYNDHQWLKLETPAPVEPTGAKGRRRKGSGRTDYLLCVQVGEMPKPLPIAVLEAKKESEDPLKGMQQAKGYAECRRFEVKYVFATNGHRYGEYDFFTNLQSGPFPFTSFPAHAILSSRYAKDSGINITQPVAKMLFMADSPAWSQSRYYQDAAIRASFEKIICSRQQGEPVRILLSLATGSGKTVIATNLLWRLHEAGQLPKPALFLCDRDELREQAYNKLKAAFGDNARIVKTESRYSWTIDFSARRARAREEMQPFLDEATRIKKVVIDLKIQLKRLKKEKADKSDLKALLADIQVQEKAAREAETKASDIDAAVFDLKAVNPNAIIKIDTRTALEIIQNIDTQGQIVTTALNRLKTMLAEES